MDRHEYLVITTSQEELLLGVWTRRDDTVLRWAGHEWVVVDEEWDAIAPRVQSWVADAFGHEARWDATTFRRALPGIPDPDDGMWLPVAYFPRQPQVRIHPPVNLPPSDDPRVRRDEIEDYMKRDLDHRLMMGEAIALASMRTCGGMAPYSPGEPDRAPWTRGEALQQAAWAEAIATEAHAGQTDKAGAPYLAHPMRVALRFDPVKQPVEHCAGWLHDVIEDTDWTAARLADAGIRPSVVDTVLLITRDGDADYYERIRRNPVARAVKLADIDDNLDPARTAELDAETRTRLARKYAAARAALGEAE